LPRISREDRERRRRTFDTVAEQYERARPAYPPELFDDLVSLTGLAPGDRVLEIGTGTGQVTVPVAAWGLRVLGVELGPRLAAIARKKLGPYPGSEVVVDDFETWEPPAEPFDAVVSMSAFHWIDPDVGFAKAHELLRKDGWLALGGNVHVWPEGGDPFWAEVQEDYDAVVPNPDNRPPPRPEDVHDLRDTIESSGRFRLVTSRTYPRELVYTADEYVAVMGTYSPNIDLDPARRTDLFERVHRRIEARPGGTMTAYNLFLLNLAQPV
jgi:SAM-dependent methyltransferase